MQLEVTLRSLAAASRLVTPKRLKQQNPHPRKNKHTRPAKHSDPLLLVDPRPSLQQRRHRERRGSEEWRERLLLPKLNAPGNCTAWHNMTFSGTKAAKRRVNGKEQFRVVGTNSQNKHTEECVRHLIVIRQRYRTANRGL
jgi:hypothetical protein